MNTIKRLEIRIEQEDCNDNPQNRMFSATMSMGSVTTDSRTLRWRHYYVRDDFDSSLGFMMELAKKALLEAARED